MDEVFRPVEGYEGLYEVSNLGRVKSLKWGKERILKPGMDGCGYLKANLYKEGKIKHFMVHRLVAQAFIPNPEGLPQINHKDEDKTNNRVDNLEWCTAKYNSNYGTRIEQMVQSRIKNGTFDSELCGIEDYKEYKHIYYQKNRDKRLEYSRMYHQKNRDQINERRREYRRRKKTS